MKKDLLTIRDLSRDDIEDILKLAYLLKKRPYKYAKALSGKVIGLIFQKPSARTRVSFDVGMRQVCGSTIYIRPEDIKLGERESIKDIARTFSRYLDGLVLRTYQHQVVAEFAQYADIPVINGLSDILHPCQGLSDIFTIKEKKGTFRGIKLAYVGDGNNVLNSLLYASSKIGLDISVAAPQVYRPDKAVMEESMRFAQESGSKIALFEDPKDAVSGADIVYTDVWASMGKEGEHEAREKAFRPYQVNRELLASAKAGALVMHCLPAHRGDEITDEVIDGENSIVFDQAENRLHVQKAILIALLK
ncbi:MAG: ornithine carbamoyltransferase [Candidatus Omnitrophica bacterium CG1_02_49_10]|nr:MAG: ornithine carbamoyltransferase [Candidatus Omnitrophica bacterium CG1_02_49_10]